MSPAFSLLASVETLVQPCSERASLVIVCMHVPTSPLHMFRRLSIRTTTCALFAACHCMSMFSWIPPFIAPFPHPPTRVLPLLHFLLYAPVPLKKTEAKRMDDQHVLIARRLSSFNFSLIAPIFFFFVAPGRYSYWRHCNLYENPCAWRVSRTTVPLSSPGRWFLTSCQSNLCPDFRFASFFRALACQPDLDCVSILLLYLLTHV